MAVDVSLPRLGQGMEAGTIVRWLKSEGDQVEKGEPLYELDTDKVTQEVEAEASGVLLKILAGEGEEIEVGKRIAVIGEQGEDVSAEAEAEVEVEEDEQEEGSPGAAREEERERGRDAAREEEEPSGEAPQPSRVNGRVKASPLARRIARERNIDLASLTGTGPEGRIVAEDVERAAATPAHATVGAAPLEAEVVPLSSIRRTIARRLTKAWEAPAFQISMSADMTRAQALRERLREQKVTVTDVLTKLAAIALLRHREVNAHFADDELRIFPSAHVGLAVATERGLVVPVIKEAERKSLVQLAVERGQLVERARDARSRTSACTASRSSPPSSTRRRLRSSPSVRSRRSRWSKRASSSSAR
jgi:pyruvate dehydrogenase E2 component (dihydrolipoyllysine-residue acetyltransferase)